MKNVWLVTLLFICNHKLCGQTKCHFKPNEERILNNDNLGYFIKNMTDTFFVSVDKKQIPQYVLEQFYCLADDSLFANRGEYYNEACVQEPGVPRRQLIFYARNTSNVILLYHRGGMSFHTIALLMRFQGHQIVDLWSGSVGHEIKSVQELAAFLEKNRFEQGVFNGDFVVF